MGFDLNPFQAAGAGLGMAPHPGDAAGRRFHGARGGGPNGKRNGMYKHGVYTKEVIQERRALSDRLRQARQAVADLPRDRDS